MPATAARLVTSRQQSYIAALAAERVVPVEYVDHVRLAAVGSLGARPASQAIAALLDAPRRTAPAAASRADGEPMPTPSVQNRAGRMLGAGGIDATVTLPSGEHVTLQVRTRRQVGRGWSNGTPGQEGSRTSVTAFGRRVGWINVDADGNWTLTLRSRNPNVRAALDALIAFASGGDLPVAHRVQTADRCGRCFRNLTDPVSIERGIGPECLGQSTGSRAADVDAQRDVQAAREGADVAARRARNESARLQRIDAEYSAAFAAREREQERAAFASDPDYRRPLSEVAAALRPLSEVAAVATSPVRSADEQRARDLISEALDAYCADRDRDFAMAIFDQLAAR